MKSSLRGQRPERHHEQPRWFVWGMRALFVLAALLLVAMLATALANHGDRFPGPGTDVGSGR